MQQQGYRASWNAESAQKEAAKREFLTFRLGTESYGIDIMKVQEIRGYEKPTAIANAPDFIKGVINLRGTIVPIVDMRIKFNVGEVTYNQLTVVIVLNVGSRVVGMVVDSVSDVVALTPPFFRAAETRPRTPPCLAQGRPLHDH